MDILYVSCIRVKNAMKERSAASMNKKKITVCIGVISVVIIVVIAALFLTLTKKQMVFVSGRLFVSTNQDVSEMVLREAEVSEYDSPYIGIIESAVSRTKEANVEFQSNFGCIGSEIIFNGNGIAVNLNGQWIQFVPKEPADLNSIIQSEQAVYEEDVAAFIKNVLADNITVDIVEYITDTSKERIKELKITEEDMPDGCYIFNSDEEVTIWKCNAETVYTFIDWNEILREQSLQKNIRQQILKNFKKTTSTPGFSSNGFSRPSPPCWCSPTPSISSGRYLTSPSM